MKLLILFVATIYIAFLPTSLSILVPQASVIDSTLSKNEDRFKAYLTMDSREQNKLDLKNTVDYKRSSNSTEQNLNSNDSGSNHEAFLHKRLYYLIFFLPYTTGNVSKWQKSHYHGEAFGNTPEKDINHHENVAEGVVSEENTKILNRKTIYPHWYVMHTPSNNKNATNGVSNMKQYNGITKGISGPTDLIQPHIVRNVSEWQKSSYEEDAMGNAHHKGVNRYENVTEDVAFDENIKVLNNKTSYPRWYVIHVPTIHKKNVANGDSNKKQYSDIAKGKFEPTDDSHVKGDIGNSEGKNMETVESKGKHTNVTNKMHLKIFYFGNKQNSNLNNESEKNSEIPIFKSLFAKLFNDGRKNEELNKDSKVSSKIDFKINNGSNGKPREATGMIQPGQKEHKANYHKYSFHPHFGEYSEGITTQNTHGLKYEISGKTEESNEPFQMNDTKENHHRKKGNGEGHENRAHAAYFMSDKHTRFFRQKRQVRTHEESEGREQGKSSGNLHDIRIERPLGNTSKSSGNTIGTPSNNASAVDSDLVKKLQNSSPAKGKAPIEDTVNKISKENGAQIFNPNPLTPEIFNGSMTSTKNLNAFPKSDSNNPVSFPPIRSNSNPKEAVNYNGGYQKDIKSTEEGKIIPESVPRSTKISTETAIGIAGNHSISEAKITTVKYSDIKNEGGKTRNRNGTTTKPIQMFLNGSSSDTKIASKMFSNNTSHTSYRNERFPGKHPFLNIDLMEDIEERINKSFLVVKESVKPDEIHHTNNLSIEEQKRQDVMYRSYENFNVTLLPVIQPFNISKKDSPDIEIQVPTMTEGTGRANITTQNPVIHTEIKNNEEVINRKSDKHKYKDGIQTKEKTDVLMNENITLPKIPLYHTNSTSGAAVKNMDEAAYRNNDDRKPLETVTDKTLVVNRSNNDAKESKQTALNDNLRSTSGGERKNIEAVAYRNNDDRKPLQTITNETQVTNRSDNGEVKVPNQTTLNHNLESTPGAEVKKIEAVSYRNNDDNKPLETITKETHVVKRSNNGEAKESNQTALNDNLGSNSGDERKNIEAVAYRSNDDHKPHETITGEIQVANRSDNGEVKESNQTTLNDNLGGTSGAEMKNIEEVAYRSNDDRKPHETITGETQVANRSDNDEIKESSQTTLNDNLGSISGADMKNIEAVAYRSNDERKPHETIADETQVVDRSDNGERKESNQTILNDNLESNPGAEVKNIETVSYRNNDDNKPLETMTKETHVVKKSNNGEAKESNQTALNDNLGSNSGTKRKNIEAVAYRSNDGHKPHETITGGIQVADRSDNGEVKESNQTTLNDNLGSTTGAELKNIEVVAYRNNDDRKPLETITNETQVVKRSDNGEVKESNQTTLNDNFGSTSGAERKNNEAVASRSSDERKSNEMITDETQIVNRSNNGGAKESNQTTLNDNLERNSTGSHLMKEVTLNVPKTEQSQTYENITTKEITTETETRSGLIDEPPHVNRRSVGDTTNHRMKQEILYPPKQLVRTNDKNNTETKITNQGMLYSDKLNATESNLNESDDTKIQLQQHMLPEQIQNFTNNISFKKFIFAAEAASGSRTKESYAYMTTESVIDNQQENTPNKQMQTVNRNTNMTGWFERKQWNAEKETSGMKIVRPSMLVKTKDDHMNEKAAAPKNSKDATSFEIQP